MLSLGKPKLKKKNRPVPAVPCKRKVEACKFLLVQKIVRARINETLVLRLSENANDDGYVLLLSFGGERWTVTY